jgi:hypothetical protein
LLANQERWEEGELGYCAGGGGMWGEKRKFGLPDLIYVIAPSVTPFGNTTIAYIEEYLYMKYVRFV